MRLTVFKTQRHLLPYKDVQKWVIPGSFRSATMSSKTHFPSTPLLPSAYWLSSSLLSHLWSQDGHGSSRTRVFTILLAQRILSCAASYPFFRPALLSGFPSFTIVGFYLNSLFLPGPLESLVWIVFLAFWLSFSEDTAFGQLHLLGRKHCSSWARDFLPATLNVGSRS